MKKSVVAIGNFDGLHLGHQDVMIHARMLADKHDFDFTVLTFSPHPRSVFQPNVAPFRISPDHIKIDLFDDLVKPDHYEVLEFTPEFQHLSADDFIEAISADLIEIGGDIVSSTRVRDHLKNAEIAQANALLGWEWYIESEVVHGDKRGRELGYPTANMHFGDCIVPSHGIYAVRIQIEGHNDWLNGAANIGIRPMFETAMPMLETFIFDFDDDLYGKNLKIKPVQKIRDEMKFDNLDDLKIQMAADCEVAKNILHNN